MCSNGGESVLTFGSLFSGIGGLDLGLERAGWTCKWQVEIDPYCRQVLDRHWPSIPKYGDIRELTGNELDRVDLLAGGFPCQDLSLAGKGAGLAGERSGLWFEYLRLICTLRPRWVFVENVPGLFVRGIDTVLGGLAEAGYDATWFCLQAADVGAPHRRERVIILAYAAVNRWGEIGTREPATSSQNVANAQRTEWREGITKGFGGSLGGGTRCLQTRREEGPGGSEQCGENVADPEISGQRPRLCPGKSQGNRGGRPVDGSSEDVANPESKQAGRILQREVKTHLSPMRHGPGKTETWSIKSSLGGMPDGISGGLDGYRWPAGPDQEQYPWEPPRVARGVKNRVPRLKGLGNAVVPAVAELIGMVIKEVDSCA